MEATRSSLEVERELKDRVRIKIKNEKKTYPRNYWIV